MLVLTGKKLFWSEFNIYFGHAYFVKLAKSSNLRRQFKNWMQFVILLVKLHIRGLLSLMPRENEISQMNPSVIELLRCNPSHNPMWIKASYTSNTQMFSFLAVSMIWSFSSYSINTYKLSCLRIKLLATVVEGNQMAPFSIASTLRCRRGRYSFLWIAPLYPSYCCVLSKEVSSTIFKVFGMTWLGIESKSHGPLANTLPTRPMSQLFKTNHSQCRRNQWVRNSLRSNRG